MAVTIPILNAANNAVSTLNGSIAAGATTLNVQTGHGAKFPAAPFLVTIGSEIIRVGAKSTDTFSSLTRGVEGTTAASHSDDDPVENRFTAGTLLGPGPMIGMTLVAYEDTEQSIQTSSATDIVTFSGLNIPARSAMFCTGLVRKAAGAASPAQLGFGLNGISYDPSGGDRSPLSVWSSTSTDRPEQAFFSLWLPPRRAGYQRAAIAHSWLTLNDGSTLVTGWFRPCHSVGLIVDTITTFRVRARFSSAAPMYVANVELYASRMY